MTSTDSHSPKILGFLCNWCSYAGADLAGVSRFHYAPELRIVRVMCSGRVDPAVVLHAFCREIDGVMVLACHPGDCHYMTGNHQAERRMKTVKRMLEHIGVNPKRLLLDWVSASEGKRFATLVSDFVEEIKGMGPLGKETTIGEIELKARLVAARNTFSQERVRWLCGKERQLVEEENVYGDPLPQEEFDQVMFDSMLKEYRRNRILLEVATEPLTVVEMAERTGLRPQVVLSSVAAMNWSGAIRVVGVDGDSPRYIAEVGGAPKLGET